MKPAKPVESKEQERIECRTLFLNPIPRLFEKSFIS